MPPTSKELDKLLETAYERLEQRAVNSKQPRYSSQKNNNDFFTGVMNWVRYAQEEEPGYSTDSRARDTWLTEFYTKEPHWAGIISSVNMIDTNRGWTMIGGRNQVARFVPILENADKNSGWRQWISQQSSGFYVTDIGPITEIGRDGRGGPMRALYHVDPTKCMLTGDVDRPLKYDGNKYPWREDDFFRLVSLKNIKDKFHGLGYCATSRALDMAKLMLGIYSHQMEMIGARAPKGLLLLQNITQEQWDEAMKVREAKLDSDMRKYYNAVAVIAQSGVDAVDAKLVALSQLPEGFDLEVFTNLLMYAYALCIGYDPIEFWPVLAGQLGRGRETDIQHRKGTGKGGLNFMLAMQEAIQGELPNSLLFEFEQRDQEGMRLDVEVAQLAANLVTTLYSGKGSQIPGPRGDQGGDGDPVVAQENPQIQPLISWEEARILLAGYNVIPDAWTHNDEEAKATDAAGIERLYRQQLMENEEVRRAAFQFPQEPIVRYSWPNRKAQVLFRRGDDALKAERFSLVKPAALIPDFGADEQEKDRSLEIEDKADLIFNIPAQLEPEKIFSEEEKIFSTHPDWVEGGWNIERGKADTLEVTVRNSKREEVPVDKSRDISFYIYGPNLALQKNLNSGVRVQGATIWVDLTTEDTAQLGGSYTYAVRVVDDLHRTWTVNEGVMGVLREIVDA